jgi:hypothetical protein
MMMKFNFGSGPIVLKGETPDGFSSIKITVDNGYDEIPTTEILKLAEKLYSAFNVNYVSLYSDDTCICTIDKEKEEGE